VSLQALMVCERRSLRQRPSGEKPTRRELDLVKRVVASGRDPNIWYALFAVAHLRRGREGIRSRT